MSLLLILEAGGLELLNLGPSYPLDLVEGTILVLELADELCRILTENFINSMPCRWWSRTAEPWFTGPPSYPLDHEVFVERIILELPDELRGRGILTEYTSGGILTEIILSPNP
jgi:hypothetical protein